MLSGNPGRLSMNFWIVPFFSPAMWYLEHLFLHHHAYGNGRGHVLMQVMP
jgi:hypothetical protein